MKMIERIAKWKDKMVFIEGSFPIPHAQGVVYSPCAAVLVEVYEDGVGVLESGNDEETIFPFASMRSITKHRAPSGIVTAPRSTLLG